MQLKRGVERVSCDFCHRRKIKCDRASRMGAGREGCSPCGLRGAVCCVDDSDDVRLRRRRQRGTLGGSEYRDQHSTAHRTTLAPSAQGPSTRGSGTTLDFSPGQVDALSEISSGNTPGLSFLDNLELSVDGTNLLDQIFGWDSSLATNCLEGHHVNQEQQAPIEQFHEPLGDKENNEGLWTSCNMSSQDFTAALQAYFKYAALALPIIYEDAFWKDYHLDYCSRSLVYAIASLGMPFTSQPNKWEIQQRIARCFRESLFEAHAEQHGLGLGRLDDLEALAIMVGFEYDGAENSSLQTHLQHLLLTHNSLVLMTLQFSRNPHHNTNLTRANERRTLLLWHVYGLDAFKMLDTKGVSRISDQEIELVPDLLRHISGGYLDAILALAVIARRVMQTLYTVGTRRKGVKSVDLLGVYAQLEDWRQDFCPMHLRRRGDTVGASASDGAGTQLQLHRAVLWLLEINCYMQIESIVQELGIQHGAGFAAEMVALRVEQEALQGVQDVVNLAPWLRRHEDFGDGSISHSLVDLSTIVRDVCAGLCVWTCTRGLKLRDKTSIYKLRSVSEHENDRSAPSAQSLGKYKEMATVLRDTVATATSHRHTEELLKRLDTQISSLDEAYGGRDI